MKRKINLKINGTSYSDEVEPRMLLIQYLREVAGAIGCSPTVVNSVVDAFQHPGSQA